MNDKNSPITIETINTIAHEYNVILRDLEKWIVQELMIQETLQMNGKNSETFLFSEWEQEELDMNTIWENMKFKKNGNIKAWYDGCELTYDGLKKKQRVHLAFIDFATYEYTNGTEDWSYMSEMWTIGGYSSGLEEYIGKLTQQGIHYIMRNELSAKKFVKMCQWLVRNVFSVVGII
ncbi:MAG: hypothetical protein KAU62_01480 [Candidatus Heimdallarchaeota archaeon]|nr:hypothetical protein [Candidatus Heimdallarchaeota archaeon]MCK4609806.1 hypothetical protein [Candidatus Heimdallarchaeota archaeon]